ncbi:hypothetical protein ACQBJO_09495 [Janibacter sp. G349]
MTSRDDCRLQGLDLGDRSQGRCDVDLHAGMVAGPADSLTRQ